MLLRSLFVSAFVLLANNCIIAADTPKTDKLNKSLANLVLTDTAGKTHALKDLNAPKAVVVVFLNFDCPVSNSYGSALAELAKEYALQNVSLFAVIPGDVTVQEINKLVKDNKFTFPVCTDPKFEIADAFKATVTPEAFVLDSKMILRYRGRIDDANRTRTHKNPAVKSQDMQDAVKAVLAGQDVKVPATVAVGCLIGTKERLVKVDAKVTYTKDVLPILQTHCQDCHRPGQVGPFSLMTYKQAVNWADDIVEYTKSKEMPPWKPVAGPEYANARKMPDADIQTLAAWVEAGCPEGNTSDAPKERTFESEWSMGKPDLILEAAEDFHVGPSGKDLFRCFVLPTGLKDDVYIVGYEVKPGNPRVVHHSLNFFDTTGQGRELLTTELNRKKADSETDHGPGYSTNMGVGFIPDPTRTKPGIPAVGMLGGWAPGQRAVKTPEGTGYFLPKGSEIILQVHYHRTGKPETDKTKLGIYLAKKPVERAFQTLTVGGLSPITMIPAGKTDYKGSGSIWLLSDCTMYTVLAHMHLIGKSVKISLTPPGGTTQTLVDIAHWDYNWQESYWFKDPIHCPKGTRIDIEALFDNSPTNSNNPYSPPKPIFFGEQTNNEMLFGFLGVSPAKPGERVRVSRTPLDKNGNPTAPTSMLFPPAMLIPRAEPPKANEPGKPVLVPYTLTDTKHVRVRVKINGKGPFNLILDTGAPAAFVTKAVAEKAGLKPDAKGWADAETLAMEGGLFIPKGRVRIEDLFQLEGMNGLGLAGVELHGVIGYDILALYKITYDFTADTLTFTPQADFTPPGIQGIGGKGGQGGLEVLGPLMKTLAAFAGIKPNFETRPRVFLGIEYDDKDTGVVVKTVLQGSPAATAGLKVGDKILRIADRDIDRARDLTRILEPMQPNTKTKIKVERGTETITLTVELGKGL